MKKVLIYKGLPASGKSTAAKKLIAENPGQYKRVNKDDLRAMLDHNHHSRSNEKFVLKVRDFVILEALEAGKHVIVDDTNLHPKHEINIRELVKGKAEVEVVDFMDVDIDTCIARDLKRPNSVGEKVIRRLYQGYLGQKLAETQGEGRLEQDPALEKAIICDLDGTLAIIHNRSPYEASKADEDLLNVPVANIVRNFRDRGYKILFLTGREDKHREPTLRFLHKHLGEAFEFSLTMRKTGDMRKDSIVKREFYDQVVKDKYYVEFILDDRNQVVDMWRGLGLTCLQVNYGDF